MNLKALSILMLAAGALGVRLHAAVAQEPAAPPPAIAPQAQPQSLAPEAGPSPVHVSDHADMVEFNLPAPYWSYYDRQKLAAQAQGGCMGPRTSPNVMFVLEHKDAFARVWAERGSRPFLMRDKKDLEAYVNAYVDAVRKQVRAQVEDAKSAYSAQEGMILHTFTFTVLPSAGGGGCAMQTAPAAEQREMRYVFVQCFVRRQDADAVEFRMFCMAPADAYAQLKPEFDYIIGSFRYSGPVADQFFVPNAPQDKVLTPRDAGRSAGGGGGTNYTLPIIIAVILIVWFVMRRRKATPAP